MIRVIMDQKRRWAPRETQFLAEWINEFHPHERVMFRVRLGKIKRDSLPQDLDESEIKMLSVYKYWADAIIIRSDELILVEAKLKPSTAVIGQIMLYRKLIKETPDLEPYWHLPIRAVLLQATYEGYVNEMCESMGIQVIYWCPPWVKDYLADLGKIKTAGKKYF